MAVDMPNSTSLHLYANILTLFRWGLFCFKKSNIWSCVSFQKSFPFLDKTSYWNEFVKVVRLRSAHLPSYLGVRTSLLYFFAWFSLLVCGPFFEQVQGRFFPSRLMHSAARPTIVSMHWCLLGKSVSGECKPTRMVSRTYLINAPALRMSVDGKDCVAAIIIAATSPWQRQQEEGLRFWIRRSSGLPFIMCRKLGDTWIKPDMAEEPTAGRISQIGIYSHSAHW